jgi:heme-degrading monooxygenase HmoA
MTMFGVLQRYDLRQEVVENFIDLLNSSVVPRVTRTPGFVSHRILNLRNGVLLSISTFEDQAAADAWARRASDALGSEPRAFLTTPPTILVGRVHDRRRSSHESSPTSIAQAAAERSSQ